MSDGEFRIHLCEVQTEDGPMKWVRNPRRPSVFVLMRVAVATATAYESAIAKGDGLFPTPEEFEIPAVVATPDAGRRNKSDRRRAPRWGKA